MASPHSLPNTPSPLVEPRSAKKLKAASENNNLWFPTDDKSLQIRGTRASDVELKKLPVVRDLEWALDKKTGERCVKNIKSNIRITAALLQRRGELVSDPCKNCSKGNGAFQGCIAAPITSDTPILQRACANCYWNGRGVHCTVRTEFERSQKAKEPVNMNKQSANEKQAMEKRADENGKKLDKESRNLLNVLMKKGETEARKATTPGLSDEESGLPTSPVMHTPLSRNFSLITLPYLSRSLSISPSLRTQLSASRLHGEILPWVVPSEHYNNLEVLKKYVNDMNRHIRILKVRIARLEEQAENEEVWSDFAADEEEIIEDNDD